MGGVILLAVSVSLDSVGTGMSYAIRGVRIPWNTRVIVALSGGFLTFLAVLIGSFFERWVPDVAFGVLGAVLLVFLGTRALADIIRKRPETDYDKDGSKVLEPAESVVLCLSMAADSVSTGFCLTSCEPLRMLFPVFCAVSGFVFLAIGNGLRLSSKIPGAFGGIVLIVLGLYRLFSYL